jgi:hypothetical protein
MPQQLAAVAEGEVGAEMAPNELPSPRSSAKARIVFIELPFNVGMAHRIKSNNKRH